MSRLELGAAEEQKINALIEWIANRFLGIMDLEERDPVRAALKAAYMAGRDNFAGKEGT
jgi:hypothetical protein